MSKDLSGDQAKAIRVALGLSGGQLASEVGAPRKAVYDWERRGTRLVPRMYAMAVLYAQSQLVRVDAHEHGS